MPDWKVTATTIHCETLDDEVTVLVYPDWSAKCTGSKKSEESGPPPACPGPDCPQVIRYKEKLAAEENQKH